MSGVIRTLKETVDHYYSNYIGTTDPVCYTTEQGVVRYYADEAYPFTGQHITVGFICIPMEQRG